MEQIRPNHVDLNKQVVHLVRHQPHLVHAQLQLGGRYLLVDAIIAGSSDTNDATMRSHSAG
jgi:hypothetical protein